MSHDDDHIGSMNLGFVEGLYAQYVKNKEAVPEAWRDYFEKMTSSESTGTYFPTFQPRGLFARHEAPVHAPLATATGDAQAAVLQEKLLQLVKAYRTLGHLIAKVDPLGIPRAPQPELFPAFWGFSDDDQDVVFSSSVLHGNEKLTLRQILEKLRATYCGSIGVQYMHIEDLTMRDWLEERMEVNANKVKLSRDEQLLILGKLSDAVIFEDFIQKKFTGATRFSLEGSESLVPLMHKALIALSDVGVKETVVGMAHRGRLNILANVMGKSAKDIFKEFEDDDPERLLGRGDVKYHLGYSCNLDMPSGHSMHLSLCFNPSHLEFVDPVALGRLRAKQERDADLTGSRGACILIHGDASFAGEGIVQETLNLSQLDAFHTGGTIHIICNNQIGFTTSPENSRSSMYCSDIAKMLQFPIFHVNGEDPEAVAHVVRLAIAFRTEYKRDVLIDMYSYRRRGHNEGDEPSFTQPLLYKAIAKRKSTREGYLEHLLQLGEVTIAEADAISQASRARLEQSLKESHTGSYSSVSTMEGLWKDFSGGNDAAVPEVQTRISEQQIQELLVAQTQVPEGFHLHPKLKRILGQRHQMSMGERPLDWGTAEALAVASLAVEGAPVRISGQDSGRGTFSHRHAIWYDYETGASYMPLQHLSPKQARVQVVNSCLSEAGVLGFEYGYSLDTPGGLTIWEAQYGDFANVAQVIVDQFISSAEDKWQRLSGLVMLLPHGFEGKGPEHSSARLERFLALAAEDNMQIAIPSNPSQYFHLLRRQVLRKWCKPLICMTPKSFLRHKENIASINDLTHGEFQRILPDPKMSQASEVKRVLLCSGKLYYELDAYRTANNIKHVAIIRIEQLYPLSLHHWQKVLSGFKDDTDIVWVQEEPENMGAWPYVERHWGHNLVGRFSLDNVCRAASASPATGSKASHDLEQSRLIIKAFGQ